MTARVSLYFSTEIRSKIFSERRSHAARGVSWGPESGRGPLEQYGHNIKGRPLSMAVYFSASIQLLRCRCAVGGESDLTISGGFPDERDIGREWLREL